MKKTFNPEVKKKVRSFQTEKERARIAKVGYKKFEKMKSRQATRGFDEESSTLQRLKERLNKIRHHAEKYQIEENGEELSEDEKLLFNLKSENVRVSEFRKMHKLMKNKEDIKEEERKCLEDFMIMQREGIAAEFLQDQLFEISQAEHENEAELQELLESNPELWVMRHLQILRGYKGALLDNKFVETPYVKPIADEIRRGIYRSEPVALLGHTGSGKSELAKQIANEVHKDLHPEATGNENFHLVPVNEHTIPSDFFGHYSLKNSSGRKNLEMSKEVKTAFREAEEGAWDEYTEWLGDQDDDKITEEEKEWKRQVIFNKMNHRMNAITESQSGTETIFEHGPLIRAMEEGKPFILDEANAATHGTLISLNDVLSSVRSFKGKNIYTLDYNGGEEIEAQPGFCVIMTGNVNTMEGGAKYEDRKPLDPSFLRRFTRKLDYDYLPQSIGGNLEDSGKDDELFQLMLATIMDKQGNIVIPEGSLHQVWEFAQTCRSLQNNYSGIQDIKNKEYADQIKKNVPSTAIILETLNAWKSDAYRFPLGYYVEKVYIKASDKGTNDESFIRNVFDDLGNLLDEGYDERIDSNDREFIHKEEVVEHAFGSMPEHMYPEERDPKVLELFNKIKQDPPSILEVYTSSDDINLLEKGIKSNEREELESKFDRYVKEEADQFNEELVEVGCPE